MSGLTVHLPTLRPVWCVQHIGTHGLVTDQHDTEHAATNQWRHLTTSRVPAVMWLGSVIDERPEGIAA